MVFAGLSSTVFGTGAFVVARPWLPRGTVARGLVFGAFLLALTGAAVVDRANADFVILGDRLLNVAMFSALFLAFGLVASSASPSWTAGCRRPRRSRPGCGPSPPCVRSRSCRG